MSFTDPSSGISFPLGHPFAGHLARTIVDRHARYRAWIDRLIAQGVRAAHPDDGWVNRDRSTIRFAYAHFDLGPRPGDLIALGDHDGYRLVRVTAIEQPRFRAFAQALGSLYHFEDADR